MRKSRAESVAHNMSKGCGCLLPVAGLIAAFSWHWWALPMALVFSQIVVSATRKTAAQYVRDECLRDAVFYRSMADSGVVQIY